MKGIIFILIIVLGFFIKNLSAQPLIEWQYLHEIYWRPHDVDITPEGNYVFTGGASRVDSAFSGYSVILLDSAGNRIWDKSFGGTKNDYSWSIVYTDDGGFMVAGDVKSRDGDLPALGPEYFRPIIWIVKLDSNGNIQWNRLLGGTGIDKGGYIRKTNDKGYILAGSTFSLDDDIYPPDINIYTGRTRFWVVKLDSLGNIQWKRDMGGTEKDEARSVEQTRDGGYIVGGNTRSYNYDVNNPYIDNLTDFWVVKLDYLGNTEWNRRTGGSGVRVTEGVVVESDDGGYVIAGDYLAPKNWPTSRDSSIFPLESGMLLIKLDSSGNEVWKKVYGGSKRDALNAMSKTHDGGYILAGYASSFDGDLSERPWSSMSGWLVKTDPQGNLEWERVLGGSNADEIYSVKQTPDRGFIVGLVTSSIDMDVQRDFSGSIGWFIKFCPWFEAGIDGNEDSLFARTKGSESFTWLDCENNFEVIDHNVPYILPADPNRKYAVASSAGNCSDTSACHSLISVSIEPSQKSPYFKLYPNPTNGVINLELNASILNNETIISIYNLSGKRILRHSTLAGGADKPPLSGPVHRLQISLEHEPAGIYIVQVQSGDYTFSEKILLE